VRALQPIPPAAPERRAAVALLAKGLARLGLPQAALEAERELAKLGGAPDEALQAVQTPNPDAAQKPRTRIYGRYDVVREVASTASARVLECIDAVRGERVAVKIFAGDLAREGGRDALARFEREVRVLGALDHPNVVPLRDYFADGPAIVLAWMPGGSLADLLVEPSGKNEGTATRAAPIAPARAVEIACALLAALGEAHRLGVLHRDVKPANVLFDAAGTARLADFGVAHLGDLSATATAGLIGTFAYMAPEQREGKPATVQTDVYGVGTLLFEMLTGDRPAADGTVPAVRPSGVHRDLDARHDDVVLALVAPEPSVRPIDTFAARSALTALAWPRNVELASARAARRRGTERIPSDRPSAARVRTEDGGSPHDLDAWSGRAIQRLPLDDTMLARVAMFARAGHPALQTVLRVDRAAEEIWLEAPRGAPLDRPLLQREAALLREALDALHAQGAVHGRVDREHVRVGAGEVTLLFAHSIAATATIDRDRLGLSRLTSSART
jgi:serine/threonine-protein kinase